jgi:diguanylate cyclase (GGDEF)-like protein
LGDLMDLVPITMSDPISNNHCKQGHARPASPLLSARHPPTMAASLVGIISIIMMLFIGWGACTVERRLISATGHSLVQAATDSASKLQLMIAERQGDMEVLSSSPIAHSQNRNELTAYLFRLLKTYHVYQWIGVTDAAGVVIAATDPASVSQDRHETHWFTQSLSTNSVTVLDAEANPDAHGQLAITITAPIRTADGRFQGAVAGVVVVPSLIDILDQTMRVLQNVEWTDESHIEFQLLNASGGLIADSTLREEGTVNLREQGLPSANLLATSERGFIEERHLRRDAPVITAYAQVTVLQARPPLQWGILIRVDRDSVLTPVRTFLHKLMLMTVLIVVPLCLLLVWLVKRIHYEWRLAEQESLRASKAEALLSSRAEALHAVVLAANDMASATDLDGLIRHMLDHAKTITGARYAVLGMLDDRLTTLSRIHTIDCDERMGRAISRLPLSGGLLHCLMVRNGVLRIADLAREIGQVDIEGTPQALGSFLGMSLRCHGRICAQLYLLDKVAGDGGRTAFTDLDEQVVLALAAQAGVSVENLQLLLDAKTQARQDSLTGLLNHSATIDALSRELSRATREHEPLAIIMADIDHFKRVNDTYGHVIGDGVIRETARRIQDTARRYDLVGRIGGEEFLVILPGCGEIAAAEIAERIRYAIAGDSFDTKTGPLSITLSLGVATCSPENPAFPQLLWELADQALYRVKQNGRNGIEFATPPPHTHYPSAA